MKSEYKMPCATSAYNKGNKMDDIYLKPKEISQIYGIPLRTVYARVHKGYYTTNENNEINTIDVEKYLEEPIKVGRRWGKKK